MKTTLPTLSEIVDITANMAYDGNFITNHIWDYNDFLKQPLKLEMFIPCKDGVNEVVFKGDFTKEQLSIILNNHKTIGDLSEKIELTDKQWKKLNL